jgi:signal peptidase I
LKEPELEAAPLAHRFWEESPEPDQRTTESDGTTDEKAARSRRGWWHLLREVAETVVLTAAIFLVVNAITGRFRIEGPSMHPNLHEGQYVIISKIEYRLHPPRRGDIIVFHHPRNVNRDLIKRVIGLPGETIEIREGVIYVDGVVLEEPYVSQRGRYSGRYELGMDEFFVLGDNRPNSDDSHNWGALDRDHIVGKAWISYWPPQDWGGVPHYGYADSPASLGEDSGSARAKNPAAIGQR